MSRLRLMDWFDTLMGVIFIALILAFVGIIIWQASIPTIITEGVIIDKYVMPGRMVFISIPTGKSFVMSPIYHSEERTFVVRRADGTTTELTIDDGVYYSHEIGDSISFQEKDYR